MIVRFPSTRKSRLLKFGNRMRGKCLPRAARACRVVQRGSIRAIIICSDKWNARGLSCNARQNRRRSTEARRTWSEDPATRVVALKIIELAQRGVHDAPTLTEIHGD